MFSRSSIKTRSISGLTTRVSNMAACQFLLRAKSFSLVFLVIQFFDSHIASSTSIRGVAVTSKSLFSLIPLQRVCKNITVFGVCFSLPCRESKSFSSWGLRCATHTIHVHDNIDFEEYKMSFRFSLFLGNHIQN